MSPDEPSHRVAVPPPKCKAMLLCDRIIVEAKTGKVSIIGCFDACNLASIPGYTIPFTIYVVLIEGVIGHDYEIAVDFYDLDDNSLLSHSIGSRALWTEGLSRNSIAMPVAPILIQHPGGYDIVVLADDQEIDRQRLAVTYTPSD
jgi:hypothetical protein